MLLALATLAALAALIWLLAMRQLTPAAEPPQARTEPRDPVSETVAKWMHDWDRGRA